MNHYNDGGGHIESSNIYDEVASFDTIANAQTDMIFHYDVVATFGSIDNAQADMIFRYEEVVNDDSMDDTQIDMIYHPDDKAIFILFLLIKMTLSFHYFFCSFKTRTPKANRPVKQM